MAAKIRREDEVIVLTGKDKGKRGKVTQVLIAKGKADMDSNMWVGMNSVDDVTLQMEKLQANSELYFLKLNMKLDCQFGWNAEVVNYV